MDRGDLPDVYALLPRSFRKKIAITSIAFLLLSGAVAPSVRDRAIAWYLSIFEHRAANAVEPFLHSIEELSIRARPHEALPAVSP